jgi:uncharacterized protein YaeQ
MALTSTIYNLTIELADVDRGVYETLELRLARHPSESAEFLLVRVLAYCLEYGEGIAFSEGGISSGDEPAICFRDLTGRMTAWIEVGAPDAERLHRGSKRTERVAIYTHREPAQLLRQWEGEKIHRAAAIPLYTFERGFITGAAERVERRSRMSLSVTGRQLYLEVAGQSFSSPVVEQRLG